jgi:hypothetical protein
MCLKAGPIKLNKVVMDLYLVDLRLSPKDFQKITPKHGFWEQRTYFHSKFVMKFRCHLKL